MIKFSDGMTFDTSGPLRVVGRSDGLYVVGNNLLIPVETREEADNIIKHENFHRKFKTAPKPKCLFNIPRGRIR